MSEQMVIDIGSRAVWVAMLVGAPALMAVLVTGLVVSVFQTATQINEQTLAFIPKVVALTAAVIAFGPWMIQTISTFTVEMFSSIVTMLH